MSYLCFANDLGVLCPLQEVSIDLCQLRRTNRNSRNPAKAVYTAFQHARPVSLRTIHKLLGCKVTLVGLQCRACRLY